MKMSVVNNMSHKYEEEKPTLSVRPSKTLLSTRAQLLDMKERIGAKKYSKIRYNTTVHKQKKGEPKTPRAAPQNEIKDLCARLNNMCPREVKGVGKAFDALVKRVEKKIEKKKDHFKDKRWKRAQGSFEIISHEVIYQTSKGRVHKFRVLIPSNIVPDIISYTVCCQEYSKLSYSQFRLALQNYIQERILAIKMSEKPKESFVNKTIDVAESKIKEILNGINCPHCSKDTKCSTCMLDKDGCLSNHQLRVLEDIVIAFVQVLTKRDVMTFIFEFIRILKTMFGVSIVNFDYVQLLPHILNPIIKCACFVNIKISDVSGFDMCQVIEFFMKLFSLGPDKKAQDAEDLGGKPIDEMGVTDTLLSDWMDTDIFRFSSNWFSYMCYLCISKKDCTNIPFLGDLMRATVDDGKKTSKDLLKYSIKTMEFIISKGKFCLEHGFITTFYHSQSTISSVKRRYDRLCEQYLCKGNPKVYGLDIKIFAKELSAMRKELTDLSRIGSIKVKDEISRMLTRIIVMDNDIRSDANVFKTRRAPFSLLIWGKTSIAKSTFVDLTIKVNCDVHGYKYAPEYIYTKNNDDERMDGYKSDMHTTVCDDVGNKHPNFSMNGDPSVTNIIQFNNNVASLTRQAEVEDKGKIPFQSDFIYFTSNTEHINAMYYMCYPAAVMRRFNYILKLELKSEFAVNGMFDASQPNVDYSTFNFWNIYVGHYEPGLDDSQRNGKVIYDITPITNIEDYFTWLADVSMKHFAQQDSRMTSLARFNDFKFLKCGHFKDKCPCKTAIRSEQKEPIGTFTNGTYILDRGQVKIVPPAQGGWDYVRYIDGGFTEACVSCIPGKQKLALWSIKAVNSVVGYVHDESLNIARSTNRLQNATRAAESILSVTVNSNAKQDSGMCKQDADWQAAAETLFPDESYLFGFVAKISATLAALYVAYKLYKSVTAPKQVTHYFTECNYRGAEAQGAVMVKEKSQFWTDNSNVLRDCDVGASSLFYKNKIKDFLDIVAQNSVMFKCELVNGNFVNIRALCLGGWCYVTNAHYLHDRKFEFVTLIQDRVDIANSNMRIKYDFSDAIIDKHKDLVYFYVKDNKPKKNITQLIYRGVLEDCIFEGCYIGRESNGSIRQIPLSKLHMTSDHVGFKNGTVLNLRTFQADIIEPTVDGDCGMPMVAFTSFGPTIVGLHVTGVNNSVSATCLSLKDIDKNNIDLRPDLTATRFKFDSAYKTLVPERLISHPAFLPVSATVLRYGSIKEGGSRVKSSVVRTDMADKFEELGYKQLKSKPPMNHYKIFNKNLIEMTDKESLVDNKILINCVNEYCRHVKDSVDFDEFKQMGKLSDEVNVNGLPGVDYIDKINRNTSMGFPWCQPKKKYLVPIANEVYPDGVTFTDETMLELNRIDYIARTGCMSQPVFQASQKDEPLPYAKCENYGTRLFFGAPTPKVMLDRKYYLKQIAFFQRNRFATRTAIGTVVQSRQWGELASCLKWKERIVAGDYSKFDKRQQIRILHAAFDILDDLARYSLQYDEVDMQAMLSIRADIVYALVHFDGDLMAFFGVLPSGDPLTTLLNCLCNIMLDMYAYVSAGNNVRQYFVEVVTITYGDDSISSVSPECTNFNHTIKQRELAKIGIIFTMAEKDKDSVPFINLSDATFLKRKFVYDVKYNIWLAPLDEDNIVSSLMVWIKSKNLTSSEQAYASMQNSAREFFFHGENKYLKMCELYRSVYEQTYHRAIYFPTFIEIMEAFESYSNEEIKQCQSGDEYNESTTLIVFLCIIFVCLLATLVIMVNLWFDPIRRRSHNTPVQGDSEHQQKIIKYLRSNVREDGISRLVLEYVGKCLVVSCKRIQYNHVLCPYHVGRYNKIILTKRYINMDTCHGCSALYKRINSNVMYLCPQCFALYYCWLCDIGSPCRNHARLRGVFTMSEEIERAVMLDTLNEDRRYDNSKDLFFRNYHRALGM